MNDLDEILKKATEWVNSGNGRAIVISAFNYKDDEVTGASESRQYNIHQRAKERYKYSIITFGKNF